MPQIIIELPADRTYLGELRLVSDKGRVVAGPFTVCGRGDRKTGAAKGNPDCDPAMPYGNTPYGTFYLVDIVQTEKATGGGPSNYGSHGAIRLKPAEGQAARAAQRGRTGLLIHGGDASASGKLRPTNGCVRLFDDDMRALLEAIARLAIKEGTPATCTIKESAKASALRAAPDEGYDEGDPPLGMAGDWHALALLAARSARDERPPLGRREEPELVAQREGHDREAHDREAHDREVHDREAHDREVHDREIHATHDRETHGRAL